VQAAGGDEIVLETGEQRPDRAAARVQQEMRVLALRHAPPMLGVGRQLVAFQHQDLVEVRRERARGAEAGGTATEDDGGPAELHPDQLLTSFIHIGIECMNDVRCVSRSQPG
jgi:hypothetical protein